MRCQIWAAYVIIAIPAKLADRAKLCIARHWEEMGCLLARMQSYLIQQRSGFEHVAFRLVPQFVDFLVRQNAKGILPLCDDRRTPASLSSLSLLAQSEAVVYIENGLT